MPIYNAQTTRENAAPLVPVQISDEIIKEAPAASQVLSRARKLRNMTSKESRMPVLSSLPLAYFVSGDTGLKQTTKVEWENVAIVAEELAVIVPIAENLIDDSSVPIWSEVKPLINEAQGQERQTMPFQNGLLPRCTGLAPRRGRPPHRCALAGNRGRR